MREPKKGDWLRRAFVFPAKLEVQAAVPVPFFGREAPLKKGTGTERRRFLEEFRAKRRSEPVPFFNSVYSLSQFGFAERRAT